jgi:hypothetical protein
MGLFKQVRICQVRKAIKRGIKNLANFLFRFVNPVVVVAGAPLPGIASF